MLAPAEGETVADLFCGLGNFTLALGRRGARVYGVEGSLELVERATQNAARNGLAERVEVFAADLFKQAPQALERLPRVDKMLIDPPRAGAFALVQALGTQAPTRIVYVSCDPATLARDAGVLVHGKGYACGLQVWSTCFPTPRMSSLSRCSSVDLSVELSTDRASDTSDPQGRPAAPAQSRWPEIAIRICSRLLNKL